MQGTWARSRAAVPFLLALAGSAALLSGSAGGPWQAPGPLQPLPLPLVNPTAQAMPMQQEQPSYLRQWAWEQLSAAFDSDGDDLASRSEFQKGGQRPLGLASSDGRHRAALRIHGLRWIR